MSIAPSTSGIEYPSSDGQPMAETPVHVQAIMLLHQALEDFFRGRPDVFVASDMFWYWEKGNRSASTAPDVMVVPNIQPRPIHERRSFKSWEEGGAVPAVVFEMASESTWEDDLEDKYDQYERLGVREYFVFDPEGLYLVPVLQGYRLRGASYRRMRAKNLESDLGFRLQPEGPMLRLIDSQTGQPIPTRAEAVEATQAAFDAERQRADALAAEVERLKKQLGGGGP